MHFTPLAHVRADTSSVLFITVPQGPGQCLAHGRGTVNFYWRNQWVISSRPQTAPCTCGRWWLALFWLWHLKMPQTLRQKNVNAQRVTVNSASHSGGHDCPSASLTVTGLLWRKDTYFFNVSTRRELTDGQSTISSLDKWGMHPLTFSSTDQCHLPLRYITSYRVVNWAYGATYSPWVIELYSWSLWFH